MIFANVFIYIFRKKGKKDRQVPVEAQVQTEMSAIVAQIFKKGAERSKSLRRREGRTGRRRERKTDRRRMRMRKRIKSGAMINRTRNDKQVPVVAQVQTEISAIVAQLFKKVAEGSKSLRRRKGTTGRRRTRMRKRMKS